jgi:hypothetical protein
MADAQPQSQTTPSNSILNNKEESSYNNTFSLLYFIACTFLYFIARHFFKSSIIITLIYYSAVILGEFFISLSISKQICGSNQYPKTALYTILPWSIIFGLLQAMLNLFPGWLVPFSNTIGYLVTKLFGIGRLFNDLLSPKIDNVGGVDSKTKITAEALEHIYNDRSLLINEITQTNFERFWDNMSNSGLFKKPVDIKLKDKLLFYVKLKDMVSEGLWYLLTGALVTSVSFNLMINSECDRSVSDIQNSASLVANELANARENANVSTSEYKVRE